MAAPYSIEPADAHFDADHPADHNRLAEVLVRILSRPEIEAEVTAALQGAD